MTDLDLVIQAARAAVTESKDRAGSTITIRPATVVGVDYEGIMAEVVMDGDPTNTAMGAQIIYPTGVNPDDRVLIMFVEPTGCFLIGRRGGDFDDWHQIGNSENPFDIFETGWGNSASTDWGPGLTYAAVAYRRHGRIVELRGRATRTSGSDPDIFILPQPYCPPNILGCMGLNGLGGACPIQIHTNGTVSAIDGSSTAILDGIMFSVNQLGETEV